MDTKLQARPDRRALFHFERSRLNDLFMEAVRYPVVVLNAGAGYGKTSAVHDFVQEYQAATAWIQLSGRDNAGARFWENFTHTLAQMSTKLAEESAKLGLPETKDTMNQYLGLLREHLEAKRRIIVMDDYHVIENPSVIRFVEECVLFSMPPGTTVFLVSRSTPRAGIAGLESKGHIFTISEHDLRFTESELARYFLGLDISLKPETLSEIMQDTEGWAFALNLVAHSYQRAPGYKGYVRSAMKTNIFQLMEREIWAEISGSLQRFLVCLSLIDHLSVELIQLLAGENEDLIIGLEKQSAYVRRDNFINAYVIHHLFLDFLTTKQELLSEGEKHHSYATAGDWCKKNGFKIDALTYYEKIGDYESIVSVFLTLSAYIPRNFAQFAAGIFDRAPQEAFTKVERLVESHIRVYICQGLWDEAVKLMQHYEAKFLEKPEDDPFTRDVLCLLYYNWGYLRHFMCTADDCYDFDVYFEKFCSYHKKTDDPGRFAFYCPGPWINCAGSSRKGAPDDYIKALTRKKNHVSYYFNGFEAGKEDLARGELLFYQGDFQGAQPLIAKTFEIARFHNFPEIMHRALCYMLRISFTEGNYHKVEKAMHDLKIHADGKEYANRHINYDISRSWYCYLLGLPEEIPQWIKEGFSPYAHAAFTENFANQMKGRFCFMTRNFPPLLEYIEEMKQRESFLFGRLEMLAMEACIHYKMKDKQKALAVLTKAYEEASPNNIVTPFIELGKDMRTLSSAALKKTGGRIPVSWLEYIKLKSASYAKRRSHIIAAYRQAKGMAGNAVLSPRETDILSDLSRGLSRTEIAAARDLSINTVKMVINSIYYKLGAGNIADLIRIAVEQKLI